MSELQNIEMYTDDTSCNLDELTSYLHSQLLQRVKIENADQNDSDQSDEQSNEASTEYISSEISQEIICFLEERILSQYELYRVALFENNPSHMKYIKFKEVNTTHTLYCNVYVILKFHLYIGICS